MTTSAGEAFLCDGFLHFSDLVLTPKLDRIHLFAMGTEMCYCAMDTGYSHASQI